MDASDIIRVVSETARKFKLALFRAFFGEGLEYIEGAGGGARRPGDGRRGVRGRVVMMMRDIRVVIERCGKGKGEGECGGQTAASETNARSARDVSATRGRLGHEGDLFLAASAGFVFDDRLGFFAFDLLSRFDHLATLVGFETVAEEEEGFEGAERAAVEFVGETNVGVGRAVAEFAQTHGLGGATFFAHGVSTLELGAAFLLLGANLAVQRLEVAQVGVSTLFSPFDSPPPRLRRPRDVSSCFSLSC